MEAIEDKGGTVSNGTVSGLVEIQQGELASAHRGEAGIARHLPVPLFDSPDPESGSILARADLRTR